MNIHYLGRFFSLLLFCAFGFFSTLPAQAQQPETNETNQILKELVSEVRLRRQALQRVNMNVHRSQVLIERIRAQNDRVSRASRAWEEAHDELADLQMNTNQFTERVKAIEAKVLQESDEKQRAELGDALKQFKYTTEQTKQQEQRAREKETRLADQLRQEQAKLDELENRLDLLDREITSEVEKLESGEKNREKKRPQ